MYSWSPGHRLSVVGSGSRDLGSKFLEERSPWYFVLTATRIVRKRLGAWLGRSESTRYPKNAMRIGKFRKEVGWDERPLESMTLLIDRSLVTKALTHARTH